MPTFDLSLNPLQMTVRYFTSVAQMLTTLRFLERKVLLILLLSLITFLIYQSSHLSQLSLRSSLPFKETKGFELKPAHLALVTYYAEQKNTTHRIHFDHKTYYALFSKTLNNIAAYCHKHGFAFFYRNAHLVDTVTKAAYWGKMDVMAHYMNAGYEWVIWTDVDVLFMDFNKSILTEWIAKVDEDKHVALVSECGKTLTERTSPRSGFMAVKNSKEGLSFLKHWKDSNKEFAKNFNPDQESLEAMMQEDLWKKMSQIFDHSLIHTYPGCFEAGKFVHPS